MSTSSINGSNASRITGMVSGMDTDSIVEKMTSGTTAKIDKVNQQKQILKWKQEDYKTIISKFMNFKSKYFSSSTSGSLSSKFYATKVAAPEDAANSKYVSVTMSPASNVSSINLSNIQLATQSVATTKQTASAQIQMSFDAGSAPIDLTGKTVSLTVDGVTKAITFQNSYNTAADLAADLKQLINTAFGVDRLSVTASGDNIVINSDGTSATLAAGTSNDAFSAGGLTLVNDKTSRIDISKSIADNTFATPVTGDTVAFTINGKNFNFTKDTSIAGIMNAINKSDAGVKMSYSSITDKFTLTSTATGASSGITMSDDTGNFLTSTIGALTADNYKVGTDASVYIDGTKITRSTNTFTIDDVTYSLKANTADTIKMNVTNDVTAAVTNIKNFVNDYNELLEAVNSKINEERHADFAPLTDAQKADMGDTEITKWEEKARSGLLKNDTLLRSIATSLRTSMITNVANLADNATNITTTLASVGIGTENYLSKGKLVVNEQKLTEALSNNPDGVISLFTQKSDKIYLPTNTTEVKAERNKESGIMYRLSDIFEDSVGTLYGSGSLLKIAGYTGTSTESENTITKSLASYEKKLNTLLDYLSQEKTRYYNRFTAMEKSISEMNQQIQYVTGSNG